MKLICTSPNGQLMFCPTRNEFILEFGNILLTLSKEELMNFKKYIDSTDYQYFLDFNKNAQNKRKLLLMVGSRHVHFAVHANEFLELRKLLSPNKDQSFNLMENFNELTHELVLN